MIIIQNRYLFYKTNWNYTQNHKNRQLLAIFLKLDRLIENINCCSYINDRFSQRSYFCFQFDKIVLENNMQNKCCLRIVHIKMIRPYSRFVAAHCPVTCICKRSQYTFSRCIYVARGFIFTCGRRKIYTDMCANMCWNNSRDVENRPRNERYR